MPLYRTVILKHTIQQSTFFSTFVWWQKEWDCKFKRPKFHHRVSGLTLREFIIRLLLFCAKRSHLRCFRHLIRILPGHVPFLSSGHIQLKGEPRELRTIWRNYISHLPRKYLGISQEEPEDMAGMRDTQDTLLSLLPLQASNSFPKNLRVTNLINNIIWGVTKRWWAIGHSKNAMFSINCASNLPVKIHWTKI